MKSTPKEYCIVRNGNVPWKKLGGKVMLLELNTGNYFALNEIGSFIWDCIEEEKPASKILHAVMERYDVSSEKANAGILTFVESLKENRLIEIR